MRMHTLFMIAVIVTLIVSPSLREMVLTPFLPNSTQAREPVDMTVKVGNKESHPGENVLIMIESKSGVNPKTVMLVDYDTYALLPVNPGDNVTIIQPGNELYYSLKQKFNLSNEKVYIMQDLNIEMRDTFSTKSLDLEDI